MGSRILENSYLNQRVILSSKDKLSLFPPSERVILWVISKDPTVFTVEFNLIVIKDLEGKKADPDSNLSKALAIAMSLQERKLIKIGAFKTTITFRGHWYRFYTHPSVTFWGILVATVIGIIAIFYAARPTIEQHPLKKDIKQPTIADSPLYHQKK